MDREIGGRWIILQTSSARTIPLFRSLRDDGIDSWTPVRTIWRPAPGQRRRLVMGQRRKMHEVDAPILPGFVFAGAQHVDELVAAALAPVSRHPAFAIFQIADRAPIVGETAIAGLRRAEAEAAADAQARRDAQSRDEARRARAEQMRTDRERRKALRRERRDFAPGERVAVIDMPAMAGMTGEVRRSSGTMATIDFGGSLIMQVEAWRVVPSALMDDAA